MAKPDITGTSITRSYEYGASQKSLTANIGVRKGATSPEIVEIDEISFGFKVDGSAVAAIQIQPDYSMKVHVRQPSGKIDTKILKFDHDEYYDVAGDRAQIAVGITPGPRMRMINLGNL